MRETRVHIYCDRCEEEMVEVEAVKVTIDDTQAERTCELCPRCRNALIDFLGRKPVQTEMVEPEEPKKEERPYRQLKEAFEALYTNPEFTKKDIMKQLEIDDRRYLTLAQAMSHQGVKRGSRVKNLMYKVSQDGLVIPV